MICLFSIFCFAIAVKINIMLPLDVIKNDGTLKDYTKLYDNLKQLKNDAKIDGIMSDVWWGIVQRNGQSSFDWNECGGNAGDACNIPLPNWVLSESSDQDIFYKDLEGHSDEEYLSLGVDQIPVFSSNSAVDLYYNFMKNFSKYFVSYIDDGTIDKIEVGLGPCGELRYPSYQLDRWKFPGVGEFQAFDKNMLQMLKQHSQHTGHPSWTSPPTDAGNYNSFPKDSNFFTNGWSTEYGDYFLGWYSQVLLNHADLVLGKANKVFGSTKVKLAAKVSGIHWWHGYDVGAAECTAGYYHTNKHNGYDSIAKLLSKYNAEFQFTCLEMTDQSQEGCQCDSQPEELVELTKSAAKQAGISYAGENALQSFSTYQLNQMLKMAHGLDAITYLRVCDQLFEGKNWQNFIDFVKSAHNISK